MSLNKNNITMKFVSGIKYIFGAIFRLLFPEEKECIVCKSAGEVICDECSAKIKRHEGILCQKCGRSIEIEGLCVQCAKKERPYYRGTIALFYEGVALQMMKDFKFENMLGYSEFFASEIYEKVKKYTEEIDVVTSVPSHFLKVIGKGYNPPALIARKIADFSDKRYMGQIIRRVRYTKSMSLLKGIDRMAHVKQNFAVGNKNVRDKCILIVDDVSTTGATLHICSELLMKAGAKKVYVAAACGDKSKNVYRIKSTAVV